jgi:Flp pilus assembly protein TadB
MNWLFLLVLMGAAGFGWAVWRAPSQSSRLPKPITRTSANPSVKSGQVPTSARILTTPLFGQRWVPKRMKFWRRSEQAPDLVMQILILVDADLRAGVSPQAALSGELATAPADYCALTRTACQVTGDVSEALKSDSRTHGEITWSLLSACWVISERYGASLSKMLAHVIGVCRQQRRAEQQLRAQLAAPQAGAKLLAGLPLLGIGLGFMLGANPLAWLFGSISGWVVLAIAIGFEVLGVWWVGRIVRAADATKSRGSEIIRAAPLAAYLIAACAKAGVSLPVAVEASAEALGEPIDGYFSGVVTQLRLGADPAQAWAPLVKLPSLALLAQVMARSAVTGSPIANSLTSVAEAAQDQFSAELERRARVAGVKVVAPLALCFLPAFMLVTVVPIVGSLLPTVLTV